MYLRKNIIMCCIIDNDDDESFKETLEKTNNLVNDIEAQIRVLASTSSIIKEKTVTIKHELFLTMVDGKVVQILTNTPFVSTCNVCRAKPSEMEKSLLAQLDTLQLRTVLLDT